MLHVKCPSEYLGAGSDKSVFLAGGISNCINWQEEMVDKLKDSALTVVNPRREQFDIAANPHLEVEQITWEHKHLLRVDSILFWFCEETLCPITLYELGAWNFRPKKLFIGCHSGYKRKRDVEIQTRLERPSQAIVYSLDDLAKQVLEWGNIGVKNAGSL